jgi:hypothetical protein
MSKNESDSTDGGGSGDDISRRMGKLATTIGVKRSAATSGIQLAAQPPVKIEKRDQDSGSESDSYDNGKRIAIKRVERGKIARENARNARAASMQARMLGLTQAQPHNARGQHLLPPPRNAAENDIRIPDADLIEIKDFLTTGELSVQMLEEVERMYSPLYFDEKMEKPNPALYAPDHEEQNRVALLHQGAFENPLAFTLLKNMLVAHPRVRMSLRDMQTEIAYLARIEPVPRAYVATMLREPRTNENPCCNGKGCLTYIWFQFVMVEFMTPMQVAQMARVNGSRSSVVGPCLLCVRKTALYMRCMAIVSGATNAENYIFQMHRNIVNRRGEYPYEYCLCVDGNVPYPMVMNLKRGYKYYKASDGRQWLTEEGYRMCTEADEAQPIFCSGTPQSKTATAAAGPATAGPAAATEAGPAGARPVPPAQQPRRL